MGEHVFETVASDTVYRGKIVALRVDQVRMPGGAVAAREVVEHYGAVAVVAVDGERRVAMVYQYRHPLGRRLLELPAGLLDAAGEDPLLTAKRELVEETGLAAQRWHTLVDVASSPGFSDEAVRIYLAEDVYEVGRPEAEHEEADLIVRWVPLDDAVQMALRGEITNAIAVSGILAAHATNGSEPRPADAEWSYRPSAFAKRQETA